MKKILAALLTLTMMLGLIMPTTAESNATAKIVNPTVNLLMDPLGIDRNAVRFGWQMQSEAIGQYQKNYQIKVTQPNGSIIWDSGVVTSDLSTGIAYSGPELALETQYTWTVTVTDKFNNKITSEASSFLTGSDFTGSDWIYPQKASTTLTDDYKTSDTALSGNTWDVAIGENWTAAMNEWMGFLPNNPAWEGGNPWDAASRPSNNYTKMGGNPLLRTKAALTKSNSEVVFAKLYMTALGNYVPYVNGEKVLMAGPKGDLVEPMFAPGALDYTRYVNYQTYDVTNLVKSNPGTVVLGAEMHKGYYAGRVASSAFNTMEGLPNHTANAKTLALRGKLVITYADGTEQVVGTNADDWKSIAGSVIFNDYYNGEIRDGNRAKELNGWATSSFDDSSWIATSSENWAKELNLLPDNRAVARWAEEMTQTPVSAYTFTTPETRSPEGEVPNKVALTAGQLSAPITMSHNPILAENKILAIDFGQNIAGTVKLTMTGDKDTVIRIRHAEIVNSAIEGEGTGGRDTQIGGLYYGAMRGSDGQVSYYKLNGEANEVWLPDTTYNGFQHVEISVVAGGTVTFNDISAKVITSAHNRTSEFMTNDPLINKMVENGYWGQVGNWTTIPTDCNQRTERVGWTGDAQLFAQAATYNFDAVPFYETYINIMDEHNVRENGVYAQVMPVGNFNTGGNRATLNSGWSDAGVVIPWTMYQQTGDKYYIENSYEHMDRYMDRVWGEGPGNIDPVTANGLTTERLNMYDHNTYYGDWLAFRGAHLTFMDAIYQIYSTELMWKMAEAVGNEEMIDKYSSRHATLKGIFLSPPVIEQVEAGESDEPNNDNRTPYGYRRTGGGFVYDTESARYVNSIKAERTPYSIEDGDIASYGSWINSYISAYMDNSQTALAWCLKLGLYKDETHKQHLIQKLDDVVKNEGNKLRNEPEYSLGVGFLGVNVLMPVVSDSGLVESAYKTIFQDGVPGWMAPVKNGATTWWERWDSFDIEKGFGAAGMNSFNHFSYGCINEWMFEYVSGFQQIESAPGFKQFVLQPSVDPTGRLTDVMGRYDSYYGEIVSEWKAENGKMTSYKCTVPANTSATLYLPISAVTAEYLAKQVDGISYEDMTVNNGVRAAQFSVESGSYELSLNEGQLWNDMEELEKAADEAQKKADEAEKKAAEAEKKAAEAEAAAKKANEDAAKETIRLKAEAEKAQTEAKRLKEEAAKAQAEAKKAKTELANARKNVGLLAPKKGSTATVGNLKYKVTKSDLSNGTVTVTKPTKKTLKKVTIPATVKISGVTFKVTAIANKAFANNKKLTTVTIGKNIKTIGKQAFNGDTKLKTITIKSSSIKKIGSSAFKNINSKATIKVPPKKLSSYKKMLKSAGVKSSVKIKK